MGQYTILSTKKLAGPLKNEAKQKGILVLEEEFIEIQSLYTREKHEETFRWISSHEPVAIVFTSRHAVNIMMNQFHQNPIAFSPEQWNIFCLAAATKDAVQESGWENRVIDTAADAGTLAKKIIANGNYKEVVFFCGNKRRDDLPALLKEHGIAVHEVLVYETKETPAIVPADLDAILFFSPSAVKSFFSVNTLSPKTACVAIGQTTASAIAGYTNNKVITSEQPTPEMIMASTWNYLQHLNCYE